MLMTSSDRLPISVIQHRNSSIKLNRNIAILSNLVHYNSRFVGGMRGLYLHNPTLFGIE